MIYKKILLSFILAAHGQFCMASVAAVTLKYLNGPSISTQVYSAESKWILSKSEINYIRQKIDGNSPSENIVVVPTGDEAALDEIKQRIASITPAQTSHVTKIITVPDSSVPDWFEPQSSLVFTILRFVLNGTVIGTTLIYSSHVSLAKALLVGLVTGSMSGFMQYHVKEFRNWLRAGSLREKFGMTEAVFDFGFEGLAKHAYNESLDFTEELSKYGLTVLGYTGVAKFVMSLLGMGGDSNPFKVAAQATLSEGVATNGLFSDLNTQKYNSDWSDTFRERFRNAGVFVLSALSVGATAFQLISPGRGGKISLWFTELPYGFAAISAIGIGFYIHSILTGWIL